MYKHTNTQNKQNNEIIPKSNKNNIEKQVSSGKNSKDYETVRDIVLNKQEIKKNDNNNKINKYQNFFI